MAKALWFKRKRYGWGWTPANLAGWSILIAYVIGNSIYPILSEQGYFSFSISIFLVVTAILTAGLIGICFAKGERPSWNWGD